jgi:N-acetylmuramoyl-L-alanine amidase
MDRACSPLVQTLQSSPNFEPRRGKTRADMLILHYTGMMSAPRVVAWFANPASRLSSHYVIDDDGRITQMVSEADRAWHAGVGSWAGETDINSASIGIEIQNPGHEHGYRDFPDAQIDAVIRLGLDICERRGIARNRVLAHSDVAPKRKDDPGEKFPWDRLHAAKLGHWQKPAPLTTQGDDSFFEGDSGEPVEEIQSLFSIYGYGIEISGTFDAQTKAVTTAFQRHFRQEKVDGIVDPSTVATLRRLLKALPKV